MRKRELKTILLCKLLRKALNLHCELPTNSTDTRRVERVDAGWHLGGPVSLCASAAAPVTPQRPANQPIATLDFMRINRQSR